MSDFNPEEYASKAEGTFDPEGYVQPENGDSWLRKNVLNPLAGTPDDAKAAARSFWNEAAMKYGPEILSEVDRTKHLLTPGAKFSDYDSEARRKHYQGILDQDSVEHPASSVIGGMLGIAATSKIPGLNFGDEITAGMKGLKGLAAHTLESGIKGGVQGYLTNPGDEGDRWENASAGATLGATIRGTTGTLGMAKDYLTPERLRNISDKAAMYATGASGTKNAELLTKRKYGIDPKTGKPFPSKGHAVGRNIYNNAITKGAWSPEAINTSLEQKAAEQGEVIDDIIRSAELADGGQTSINTVKLADSIERRAPGTDPFFITDKGKWVLSHQAPGSFQGELGNLRRGIGQPISNPAMLGADAGGHAVVPNKPSVPVDSEPISSVDTYFGKSPPGDGPGPKMVKDPMQVWQETHGQSQGYPPRMGDVVEPPPPGRVSGMGDVMPPYGETRGVGPTYVMGSGTDTRDFSASPSQLRAHSTGLGKRVDFAKRLEEMEGQDAALAPMYFAERDAINQTVEGLHGQQGKPSPDLAGKMNEEHLTLEGADMALQGMGREKVSRLQPADSAGFGRRFATRVLSETIYAPTSRIAGKVAEILEREPGKLGRAAGALMKAYSQGPNAFNAAVYSYWHGRPEFREAITGQTEDRSLQSVMPLSEAQSQFIDSN